jgi:hypothetical protein
MLRILVGLESIKHVSVHIWSLVLVWESRSVFVFGVEPVASCFVSVQNRDCWFRSNNDLFRVFCYDLRLFGKN